MKDLTILIFVFSLGHYSTAQPSAYWGQLTPGKFEVGYQDTVLYNTDQHYTFENYKGPKPYFTHIWFPLDTKTGSQIRFGEYLKLDRIQGLEIVTDSIQRVQESSFIRHTITNNLDSWENEEPTYGINQLKERILTEQLNVFKTSQFPESHYPTIIYHHGSGGIPIENSVLFEYLASHGYVVISVDYHWPELRGRPYTQLMDNSLEDVEFIAKFSESLPFTDRQKLVYIGHSWGGGVALRLNQKQNPRFRQYIILDSTIEKAGLSEFRDVNPLLDSLFRNHPEDFKTKTIVITSRASYYSEGTHFTIQPFPEFLPFQFLNTDKFTFITLPDILNHGSYTSTYLIRSVFSDDFVQNDEITVKEQFQTYQGLVKLTKDILEGARLTGSDLLIYDHLLVKEDFDIFLYKFSNDQQFQQSRIKFPLEVLAWKDRKNIFMGTVTRNLNPEEWTHHYLFIKDSYSVQIYDNHESKLRDTNERLIHVIDPAKKIDVKYFYTLTDNKWYLTKMVDLGN